ncbi:MAG TPA: hypothetical protein VFG69_06015 [Nannocystaceae bacterium]|nr:hypothetical protein [Nannocystaceae bacterium]
MIFRDEHDAILGGQTLSALRSRILLGVLVDEEVERLGTPATKADLDEATRWFRTQFSLLERADVEDFMAFADLDLRSLSAQMKTFANIARLADRYRAEIDRGLPAFCALMRLDDRRGKGEIP